MGLAPFERETGPVLPQKIEVPEPLSERDVADGLATIMAAQTADNASRIGGKVREVIRLLRKCKDPLLTGKVVEAVFPALIAHKPAVKPSELKEFSYSLDINDNFLRILLMAELLSACHNNSALRRQFVKSASMALPILLEANNWIVAKSLLEQIAHISGRPSSAFHRLAARMDSGAIILVMMPEGVHASLEFAIVRGHNDISLSSNIDPPFKGFSFRLWRRASNWRRRRVAERNQLNLLAAAKEVLRREEQLPSLADVLQRKLCGPGNGLS